MTSVRLSEAMNGGGVYTCLMLPILQEQVQSQATFAGCLDNERRGEDEGLTCNEADNNYLAYPVQLGARGTRVGFSRLHVSQHQPRGQSPWSRGGRGWHHDRLISKWGRESDGGRVLHFCSISHVTALLNSSHW
ncbi:hypothetical protein C0Q70_10259 [Pomacea canaliculata]|uniref:Uncharacterized protein n=1 Tax=Pomacea canaliculata TaxID=400727 RepID=A0A2T7PC33_POMCA|nr:hypothetical protein C0Q70_10259 [Pomacea canaliculata]